MIIKNFKDYKPEIADDVFIAETAVIIGEVVLKKGAQVWYNSILRGDMGKLEIGENSVIEDNCMIHAAIKKGHELKIGDRVTVGHNAIVHGCEVGNDVLIAMGAIILNGAKVGNNCIIAAGATVMENQIIPDNSIVVGTPAKVKGKVTQEHLELIEYTWKLYRDLIDDYREED